METAFFLSHSKCSLSFSCTFFNPRRTHVKLLKIEQGQVNLNHGLVTVKGLERDDEELAYLLDADFYTEQKIERNGDVWDILDHFNKSAGKFFRWSITDILREAMEPQQIDDAEV